MTAAERPCITAFFCILKASDFAPLYFYKFALDIFLIFLLNYNIFVDTLSSFNGISSFLHSPESANFPSEPISVKKHALTETIHN